MSSVAGVTTIEENQVTSQPTDIFGKAIQVGDNIVYATRRGSETFLNKLKITEVNSNQLKGFNPDDTYRRSRTLTNFRTVAKVF